MITASMTSGEIRRVRNLDEARIYEFQMRKANELKREMRKQNVRQITKTFEFATPECRLFHRCRCKTWRCICFRFVHLSEGNQRVYSYE